MFSTAFRIQNTTKTVSCQTRQTIKLYSLIKSHFPDHIDILFVTVSSFLSQYKNDQQNKHSMMVTLSSCKTVSFLLTGIKGRTIHYNNVCDNVSCLII